MLQKYDYFTKPPKKFHKLLLFIHQYPAVDFWPLGRATMFFASQGHTLKERMLKGCALTMSDGFLALTQQFNIPF